MAPPRVSRKLLILISVISFVAAVGAGAWQFVSKYSRQWELSAAAGSGDLSRVQRLVEDGADINVTPTDWEGAGSGFPPLITASMEGHDDVVKFLLDHGANTEVRVEDTPLLLAVIKGHENITKMLLDHGANPNTRGEGTPLLNAISRGDIEIVKLLLDHGANPNLGIGDSTPLVEAQHDQEMVDLLRMHGAKQ